MPANGIQLEHIFNLRNISEAQKQLAASLLSDCEGDATDAFILSKDHADFLARMPIARDTEAEPESRMRGDPYSIWNWWIEVANIFLGMVRNRMGTPELTEGSHQRRSGWLRSRDGRNHLEWINYQRYEEYSEHNQAEEEEIRIEEVADQGMPLVEFNQSVPVHHSTVNYGWTTSSQVMVEPDPQVWVTQDSNGNPAIINDGSMRVSYSEHVNRALSVRRPGSADGTDPAEGEPEPRLRRGVPGGRGARDGQWTQVQVTRHRQFSPRMAEVTLAEETVEAPNQTAINNEEDQAVQLQRIADHLRIIEEWGERPPLRPGAVQTTQSEQTLANHFNSLTMAAASSDLLLADAAQIALRRALVSITVEGDLRSGSAGRSIPVSSTITLTQGEDGNNNS